METFLEIFVKTIALLNHFIFEYFSMFWNKELNILSTITDSLHLMYHYICATFNQRLNIQFCLFSYVW
jgi:hypothetical protein